MPKSIIYRNNAIIYFQGDKPDTIPVLKEGRAELSYKDLQTGETIREPIQKGEFFGVRPILGNYVYDETAMTRSDCTVVHFTPAEFEKVVTDNPRILIKMLQVFSTQLRRIHHQVQNMLSVDQVAPNPEAGLFAVGEYYLGEGQYFQAAQVFRTYLKYWPKGIYAPQAALKINKAESSGTAENTKENSPKEITYDHLSYTEIENYYEKGRYKDAMKAYLALIRQDVDKEHLASAEYRLACCLYQLEKYKDAIKQFVIVIRKYPKHAQLVDSLYMMGLAYTALGESEKAADLLRKARKMTRDGGDLYRKIMESLRSLGATI